LCVGKILRLLQKEKKKRIKLVNINVIDQKIMNLQFSIESFEVDIVF